MTRASAMNETHDVQAAQPLNPLAAFTLVLVFPRRTFERLMERPHWILPLIFVILSSMMSSVYAFKGGFMESYLESAALRTGFSPVEIESGFVAAAVLMSVVAVPIILCIEALFLRLTALAFGGRASFRRVFSVVTHASVPVGIGSVLFAVLLPLTRSPQAGANLAFLVDGTAHSFLWGLARQIDLFSIWFFILLAIGAEPLFDLPRGKARRTVLVFAVAYVLLMAWWGGGGAGTFDDPLSDWQSAETSVGTLHHDGLPAETVRQATSALARAVALSDSALGARSTPRIACYVYPSIERKRLITDNREVAHASPWADAVHVAWVEGAPVALTRAVTKVAGAAQPTNVYNPFVRTGTAVFASGTWGGLSVRDAAAGLEARGSLPRLEQLVDPAQYAAVDPTRSEPAAGAFMAWVAEKRGLDALRALLSSSERNPSDLGRVLEDTFADSLGGIEARFREYLSAEPDTSNTGEE
ncbi:MAG: hypothetical protein GF405_00870 [Candidatus Eisenbacteria bacterium]|nr:hypothetical protein [Candidatus Eisenbacteria bacterium]